MSGRGNDDRLEFFDITITELSEWLLGKGFGFGFGSGFGF
jgi:hypothetical protein